MIRTKFMINPICLCVYWSVCLNQSPLELSREASLTISLEVGYSIGG